ncbi:cysteine desulfurase family protein [Methylosoma difficile]
MIYFDHNATTPLDARVLAAMLPYLQSFYGNPSSLYRHGRFARTAIDTAREQVAVLVGATAPQIVFTSGGTEANHLAFSVLTKPARFAVSAIEHPSVFQQAMRLQSLGHEGMIIPVKQNGLLDFDIDAVKQAKPELVSMMMVNNETGAIQDVARFAQALHGDGIWVHTDAVQALGKIPLSFNDLPVHMMSLSSHKIYGPKGCGALVFEKSVPLNPLFVGGGQEQGLRAGTENVAAIVGFGKAAELAKAELADRQHHLATLKTILEAGLKALPKVTLFAEHSPRVANTVQWGVEGVDGEMLLMKLDQKGIAVSSGSACASGGSEPSPVLVAMGYAPEQAKTAVRISLGKDNTEADVLTFLNVLKTLI